MSLPLLFILTVDTLTHRFHTSAVLPQCLLVKDRQKYGRRFQVSAIFLFFILCQISLSNFWFDRTFPTGGQTLVGIRLRPNNLYNVLLHFSFGVLTFVPIHCCAVVQTISKLHEQGFLCWENKCDSTSEKQHATVNNFTVTCSSQIKKKIGIFLQTVVHQITVRYLACNKVYVSERKLRYVTSHFLNDILYGWPSASYMNTGLSELKTFVSFNI